jgi:hypothetical protein
VDLPGEAAIEPVVEFLGALQNEQTSSQHIQFLGMLWCRHGQVGKSKLVRMTTELRQN